MRGEILPNILSPVLVVATIRMAHVIIMEASLSFLGLGVQPPAVSWGGMVADGREFLADGWWVATLPGLAILVVVLAINLASQGAARGVRSAVASMTRRARILCIRGLRVTLPWRPGRGARGGRRRSGCAAAANAWASSASPAPARRVTFLAALGLLPPPRRVDAENGIVVEGQRICADCRRPDGARCAGATSR